MAETLWRLIVTPPSTGAMNMAIDQAIMEAVARGDVRPTLRFFAWEPPCLSLGYMQPVEEIDRDALARHGWDLVRRMTGGRAILHTDELTYSVTVSASDPIVTGGVVDSYRRLSRALVRGLHLLGITPEADRRADHHRGTGRPVCFEVPSHYEITANGKKLIGSAQVRKFGVVLQHGTLPLHGDISRICDALRFRDETQRDAVRRRVRQRATTLEEVLGYSLPWREAVAVMIRGFEETFSLRFLQEAALTEPEQVRAKQLHDEQYAAESWTARH